MLRSYFPDAVSILAGVCSGGVLGGFITTKSEMGAGGFQIRVDPLAKIQTGKAIKVFIKAAISIILMACLITFIVLGILRLSGIDYLKGELRTIFIFAFLAGAGIGKYIRYLYWRSRD